jgi:glycogen(starch) synthase
MRILVISNLYPPYHAGGYELACMEMVENLKARGHDIIVLTSTYGEGKVQSGGDVYRRLMLRFARSVNWTDGVIKEVTNQTAFRRACKEFGPEVVFLWNISHISISLATMAHEMRLPTCYYLFDNWLAAWEMDQWCQLWRHETNKLYHRFLKFLSRKFCLVIPPFLLDMSSAVFASTYLKNVALKAGKSVETASVVHWGIDINKFPYESKDCQACNRLLYVGQIVPHKGIHTVIEALGVIKRSHGDNSLSLTIVGDYDSSGEYTTYLKDIAKRYGVIEQISFAGPVLRENLPEVYHSHDILVFPSLWEEPFGITQLEAMSSGLAVVSTGTGGSAEILENGANALTYNEDDAAQCARQISRLLENRSLFDRLRRNARKTVEKSFQIDRTVDSLEKTLAEAVSRQDSAENRYKMQTTSMEVKRPESEIEVARCKKRPRLVELQCQALRILNLLRWAKGLITRAEIIVGVKSLSILRRFSLLPALLEPGEFSLNAKEISKVLVIQLGEEDRAVLTSSFLRELRGFLPDAWIGLIVRHCTYTIFEKSPYVDKILIFDGMGIGNFEKVTKGPVLGWLNAIGYAIRNLRKYRVDLAILPGWEDGKSLTVSHALMRLTGAPWRVGYLDAPAEETISTKTSLDPPFTCGPRKSLRRHEVESQLDILRFMGAHIASSHVEVWLSEEDHMYAEHIMDKAGIGAVDLVVALSPGRHDSRIEWPVDRYIQVGRWLQENYNSHILIMANQGGVQFGLQIERNLIRERTVNLDTKSSIRQMAALLKKCKLFVGTYSVLMHLAAAVGLPVIAIFGPEDYRRFSPWGAGHEMIRLDLTCGQCGDDCIYSSPQCIEGIEVNQVRRLISAKLEMTLNGLPEKSSPQH